MKTKETFANPTIIEAVIEVRFAKPIDNEKVQKALSSEYDCKREELLAFTAQLTPEHTVVSRNQTGQFRLRFLIKKRVAALVYPDKVSFHWQGKYPGWDVLKPAFKTFWTKLLKVSPEITANRVGVRFINMINEKTADQEVGHWLKSSVNYPAGLLSSKKGYFYSIRRPLKSEHHVQLFVAEGEPVEGNRNRPLILDIDVQSDDIAKRETPQKDLMGLIENLHEELFDVFKRSLTQDYLNLLNKKLV